MRSPWPNAQQLVRSCFPYLVLPHDLVIELLDFMQCQACLHYSLLEHGREGSDFLLRYGLAPSAAPGDYIIDAALFQGCRVSIQKRLGIGAQHPEVWECILA